LGHLLLDGEHHCGAALLSADWIVTAAHCITAAGGQRLQAVFGDYDATAPENTEQPFDLAEIVVHPAFNTANGLIDDHDLALARLSLDADFDRSVQPIEVEGCASPDRVWIAGWGKRGVDEPASDKIEAVQLSVLDQTACRTHLASLDAAGQAGDVLCVGGASGDPGACHKDSGDPAMSKSADGAWQLVAVVSSGGPECDEYTIATRLAQFRDWISMYVET
jgi:secreted trypsin-like serine protease